MKEGEQLKHFIDNQGKSKISIARDLGISKQTLFQYFQSRELSPDVKKKVEAYFGKKIFTMPPERASMTNGQGNTDHVLRETQPDYYPPTIEKLADSNQRLARSIEKMVAIIESKEKRTQADLDEILRTQQVVAAQTMEYQAFAIELGQEVSGQKKSGKKVLAELYQRAAERFVRITKEGVGFE